MKLDSTPSLFGEMETQGAFQKSWYLKLNDPENHRALWLRFSLLSTRNRFKRVAETTAVFFQKLAGREVKKIGLKQTHDIKAFSSPVKSDIRIGKCEIFEQGTKGLIQSKNHSLSWNLSFTAERESTFDILPGILSRSGLIRSSAVTLCEDLLFSGTTEINGEIIQWRQAPGMQGFSTGTKAGHSWVWGHCNTFLNESGKPTSFIFEGMSTRAQIGPLVVPRLSSFYFYYQDQNYYFNTLLDAIYIKSKHSLNTWEFQADRGELSFRGTVQAEHKDFAGLTYEDTNGSLLYCTNSQIADMTILVYRRGKLEATFTSLGTGSFEIVSREKNPYVPLML